MDQSFGFQSASSNFHIPNASSFDFTLPNDWQMVPSGFFSPGFHSSANFNSTEAFDTSQVVPYNLTLPPYQSLPNSLELVPLSSYNSPPTTPISQGVVVFNGSAQGSSTRRKKQSGIPQAERDYLDMLMEKLPGSVSQIRKDFNEKFHKNMSIPAIGMRIDRRKKEKMKEKERETENWGVIQGKITRSTRTQIRREWSDLDVQYSS